MVDDEFIAAYAARRADRSLHKRQEWTCAVLNRPVPQTPQKFDLWDSVLSSCFTTCALAGGGGYVLGMAFGFVFSAMEQSEVDTSLGFRAQLKQVYRGTWRKMKAQGKAFGGFGAVYIAYECPLENFRGTHDIWNSFFAGTCTGGTFAVIGRSSAKATAFASISCGLFCLLIEMIMH